MTWIYRLAVTVLVLAWKGIDTPTVTLGPGTHIKAPWLRVSRGARLVAQNAVFEVVSEEPDE